MSLDGVVLADVERLRRERDDAHSFVVTGPRGSGKSFVLRAIVDGLVRRQLARATDDVLDCVQSRERDAVMDNALPAAVRASQAVMATTTTMTHMCTSAVAGAEVGCVCTLDYVGLCQLQQQQQQQATAPSLTFDFRDSTVIVVDDVDVLWRLCQMQTADAATAADTHVAVSLQQQEPRGGSLTSLLQRCLVDLLRSPRCALVASTQHYDALPRFLRTSRYKQLPALHYALPAHPLGAAAARRLVHALPPFQRSAALHTTCAGNDTGVCRTADVTEAASLTCSRHALIMGVCVSLHTHNAAATTRTVRWLDGLCGDATSSVFTAAVVRPHPMATLRRTSSEAAGSNSDADADNNDRHHHHHHHNKSSGSSSGGGDDTDSCIWREPLYGLDVLETRLRKLIGVFAAHIHGDMSTRYTKQDASVGATTHGSTTVASAAAAAAAAADNVAGGSGALLASLRGSTGILLHGPSGCGKTALTRRLAAAFPAVTFLHVPCTQLFSKYLGESEERLRRVYRRARARAPAVVVLDNIDVIAQSRGTAHTDGQGGGGTGHLQVSVHRRMLACLLCELDGIGDNSRVLTLATTNALHVLDAALLRQGRLETLLHVPPLSHAAAHAMARHTFDNLAVHNTPHASDCDGMHDERAADGAVLCTQRGAAADVDVLAACVAARASHCTPVALRYVLRKVVEHVLDRDGRLCACTPYRLPTRACVEALLASHSSMLMPPPAT